jgi:hypothetical protein
MHWHRYYIWAYETALRTECDYKGYQPYWDWSKYSDIVNSYVPYHIDQHKHNTTNSLPQAPSSTATNGPWAATATPSPTPVRWASPPAPEADA